jgi:predicted amidohydrolase
MAQKHPKLEEESSVLAAVLQMNSGPDVEKNLAALQGLVRKSAARGAQLVVAPEGATCLGPDEARVAASEPLPRGGPVLEELVRIARESKVHLVTGFWELPSIATSATDERPRVRNACVHLTPEGDVAAVYRKIHLFDVRLPSGEAHDESSSIERGTEVVVTQTPAGVLGLSICYDVRFPELYRALVGKGATAIAIPSAFTVTTGKDHWHVLVRARAIESQCYVLAAAQTGTHYAARASYGHALICDPWGCVVAEASDGVGVAVAAVELDRVRAVRQALPSLQHRVLV